MARHPTPAAHLRTLAELAQPKRISGLGPVAARFITSLRLIALHDRANRDPVPELANRLGSVEVAAKSLALSQAIASIWPDNIHVSRFCCQFLTHDEVTIGAVIDCACDRDRAGFEVQVEDLIPPERAHRLWDSVLALISAEMRAI